MNMGRRGLLKLIGATPAVAAMAPAIAAQSAGMGVVGLGAAIGGSRSLGVPVPQAIGGNPLKLFSFADWIKRNSADIRRQSRRVDVLDPDIACMRLPLQTKVRMQADRQYQRLIEENKSWFERILEREGHVEIWQ